MLFWYNIIVKYFWNILEQLNWENYVKTIPDTVSADFISILCWDTSSGIELFASIPRAAQSSFSGSNTWCALHCCSPLAPAPGPPGCRWWAFHPDTGELLGLSGSCSTALRWVSERSETSLLLCLTSSRDTFSLSQDSPLLWLNCNLSFYPFNHSHTPWTWN